MSRDYRDQRGRPPSGKGHSCSGCTYCNRGGYKPAARRKQRRSAKAAIAEQRTPQAISATDLEKK